MENEELSPQQYRNLMLMTLVGGLLLGWLYALTYISHFDIEQMLDRGVLFARDSKIVFYGNASSAGMGNVPGGLSSILVGVPLKIWFSPYSVMLFLILTHLLAFFFLYQTLKNYFTPLTMVFFSIIYWVSPWHLSEFYIWNPSYLFLPMALHLWSANKMKDRACFWPGFIHVASIWYAFQIHNSSIILALISLLLFWQGKIKIRWSAVTISAMVGLATLLPYFQLLLTDPNLSPEIRDERFFLFRGLLYIFPMLKAVLYWLRFGSTVFPKHIFQNLDLNWLANENLRIAVNIFMIGVKYGFAAITGWFAIKLNWQFFRKRKNLFRLRWDTENFAWIDYYCLAGFIALLVAAAMSPIDLIYWHLIILYPVALIPVLCFFQAGKSVELKHKVMVLLFAYFAFYNIVAAVGSEKHSIYSRPHQDFIYKYGS